MCESSVSILNRHSRIYHTPLVMNHALLLSLICGRGDVVTRSILRLSADAYEMQLCEQGLARHGTALALATIPPAPAVGAPAGALDPVFALIVAHKQIMETVRATAAEIRHSTEDEASALEKGVFAEQNSDEFDLFVELTEAVATTLAGVVALVIYLDEVNKTDPWKFEDNYATPLIGALAKAFNRMAVTS